MDLSKLSIQELKALCYDQLVIKEQAEGNIRLIGQEIAGKGNEPEDEPKDEGDE